MALPRSEYVQEGKVGVYHCTTLQFLTSIFAVEVITYSVMDNHYHITLRIRPDIAESWSDFDVASRWLTLCPKRYRSKKAKQVPVEDQIRNLAACSERIAILRKRLCSLSWFMKYINEYIARAANKEDGVKGRFWESRFKCQHLLDEAAIAACMVYVDLNPIRAGMALLIAALCAEGRSRIHNIGQIERGYERIDTRLRSLGARIERVD